MSNALEITKDTVITTIATTKLSVIKENAEDIANFFEIIYNKVKGLEGNQN